MTLGGGLNAAHDFPGDLKCKAPRQGIGRGVVRERSFQQPALAETLPNKRPNIKAGGEQHQVVAPCAGVPKLAGAKGGKAGTLGRPEMTLAEAGLEENQSTRLAPPSKVKEDQKPSKNPICELLTPSLCLRGPVPLNLRPWRKQHHTKHKTGL